MVLAISARTAVGLAVVVSNVMTQGLGAAAIRLGGLDRLFLAVPEPLHIVLVESADEPASDSWFSYVQSRLHRSDCCVPGSRLPDYAR